MKPYQDPALTPRKRAEALLAAMTTEEKCMQLGCISDHEVYDDTLSLSREVMQSVIPDGIGGLVLYPKTKLCDVDICSREIREIQRYLVEDTRLGIPALPHVEAICGAWVFGATNFPEPIGLAATWNPAGVEEMAEAIRKELRAIGYRQVLSPVVDIIRDPRWGRVGETYGEDPYLSSAMAGGLCARHSGRRAERRHPGNPQAFSWIRVSRRRAEYGDTAHHAAGIVRGVCASVRRVRARGRYPLYHEQLWEYRRHSDQRIQGNSHRPPAWHDGL